MQRFLDDTQGCVSVMGDRKSGVTGKELPRKIATNSSSPLMGDACMDADGTTPRMESVESSLEQRPRATQDAKAED